MGTLARLGVPAGRANGRLLRLVQPDRMAVRSITLALAIPFPDDRRWLEAHGSELIVNLEKLVEVTSDTASCQCRM